MRCACAALAQGSFCFFVAAACAAEWFWLALDDVWRLRLAVFACGAFPRLLLGTRQPAAYGGWGRQWIC